MAEGKVTYHQKAQEVPLPYLLMLPVGCLASPLGGTLSC